MTESRVPIDSVTLPKRPLVITVGNLKGGVGKTTAVFFLACFYALVLGLKVVVIDADPLSQTGYSWRRKMIRAGFEPPFELVAFPSPHVDDAIRDTREDADIVLVDVGGESDAILKSAVTQSDILLMVTSVNPSEFSRVASTFRAASAAAAEMANPPKIDVYVLLSKVPVAKRNGKNVSTELRDARALLEEADYLVLDTHASNWKWYRESADSTGVPVGNPLEDQGEYAGVGIEILARYAAFLADEDYEPDQTVVPAEPTHASEVDA